jgi:2-polyprenyl-6-methoxyphenol hydroxylase-like FAD-dependent oxidoreductase
MDALLPGLTGELTQHGAIVPGDIGTHGRWWVGGDRLIECQLGVSGLAASRQLVESTLRSRVRGLPGVEVHDRVDVLGLTTDSRRSRVTGVQVCSRDDNAASEFVATDLVVDATGRSAPAAKWFGAHGWGVPEEERVEIGVRYATTHVAALAEDLDGAGATISAATPDRPRGGVAMRQEDQTWIVTLFGYADEQPPLDDEGFRRYARTIVSPDITDLLAGRDLLEAPHAFRLSSSRLRRYDELEGLPGGYIAIGDAICSLDPTFGQGMSVAALEAVALREEVARGLDGLGRRFRPRAAKIASQAWDLIVGADLDLPGVRGARPRGHGLISRYMRRVIRAAHHDPSVAAAFLRVSNLLEPPASLMSPRIAGRVLFHRTAA